MKRLFIALTAALAFSAQAGFKTGNQLYNDMQSNSAMNRMNALGYVAGVADALAGVMICLPPTAQAGQIYDLVENFMRDKPEVRHNPADHVVAAILGVAFPCKRGGGT